LLQLGRVIARGSELEQRVLDAMAAMGAEAIVHQQLPKMAQQTISSRDIVSHIEGAIRNMSGSSPERLRHWLQRCRGALKQRNDLVEDAWLSAAAHPGPEALSACDPTHWTEEKMSALAAEMVELIIEAANLIGGATNVAKNETAVTPAVAEHSPDQGFPPDPAGKRESRTPRPRVDETNPRRPRRGCTTSTSAGPGRARQSLSLRRSVPA
jgi:hypothetical protein